MEVLQAERWKYSSYHLRRDVTPKMNMHQLVLFGMGSREAGILARDLGQQHADSGICVTYPVTFARTKRRILLL